MRSKRVLKGGGSFALNTSTLSQTVAAKAAEASGDRFNDLQRRLSGFKRRHKKETKRTGIKFDWIRECRDLNERSERCESSVVAGLRGFEGGVFEGLADEAAAAYKVDRGEMKGRMEEVRAVLDVLKANGKSEGMEKVRAVFAEMLLRCKEGLGDGGDDRRRLEKEEKEARRAVLRSLREGEDVPGLIDESIEETGFGDTVDMELLREEVRGKLGESRLELELALTAAGQPAQQQFEGEGSDESDEADVAFVKVVGEWERSGKQGGGRRLMERLLVEMPGVARDGLEARLKKFNEGRARRDKIADAKAAAARREKAIQDWAIRAVEATKTALIKRAESEHEMKIRELMREEAREELGRLREKRDEKQRVVDEDEERRQEEERAKREEEEGRWREMQEERRELVRRHKEILREEEEEEARRREEEANIEEENRKIRMAENGERVVYRTAVLQEKARREEHERELERMRERERMERLDAIARSVPYWDAVENAKADLGKGTVATENGGYKEDMRGLEDFQIGVGKLNSFTNEKVFSDVRFRLGAALHAAGIAGTAASGAVIRRLIPREPERTTGIGLR